MSFHYNIDSEVSTSYKHSIFYLPCKTSKVGSDLTSYSPRSFYLSHFSLPAQSLRLIQNIYTVKMRSDFILVLFTIGALICSTYASPVSSVVQEEDDQKKMKVLLDLIDQAAKSQQEDGEGDKESVAAQKFQRAFSGLLRRGKSFVRGNRRGILKGLGRFASGALSGLFGGGCGSEAVTAKKSLTKKQNGNDNIVREEDFYDEDDDDLVAAIESLPEEAQEQLLSTLLPLGISLLSNLFRKG